MSALNSSTCCSFSNIFFMSLFSVSCICFRSNSILVSFLFSFSLASSNSFLKASISCTFSLNSTAFLYVFSSASMVSLSSSSVFCNSICNCSTISSASNLILVSSSSNSFKESSSSLNSDNRFPIGRTFSPLASSSSPEKSDFVEVIAVVVVVIVVVCGEMFSTVCLWVLYFCSHKN